MHNTWYEEGTKCIEVVDEVPADIEPQDNVDDPGESDEERFCFCRDPGWLGGHFISCTEPTCKIIWYHMACVKIDNRHVPLGDWLCPRCQKLDHWCICGRSGTKIGYDFQLQCSQLFSFHRLGT